MLDVEVARSKPKLPQAGFGDSNIELIHIGAMHDHNPNASLPKLFAYEVGDNCEET